MPQQLNIRIWWDVSVSVYRMTSPYNASLVDALKQFIPVSDRSYDPTTKVWSFVERQLAPLQALLKQLNMQPVIITRQQAEQAATQSQSNAGAGTSAARVKSLDTVIIEFVKLLPYDAARSAYRKAAMELHPDKGGDAARSANLNDAWSRIAKEVYGQQ